MNHQEVTSNGGLDGIYLEEIMESLINTPSPVGFYELITPVVTENLDKLGISYEIDERHNIYVWLEGEDTGRTVLVGAHLDTLGYMVSAITDNGALKLKELGGVQNHSLENEKCYLYTRDLHRYTGYIVPTHHSVHVYSDAKTLPRDIENMRFSLDEDVSDRAGVRALGIRVGDIICPEPHYDLLLNGRIRSRFLDDKAGVAGMFAVLKYLRENQLKPRYNTYFAFSFYEEMNAGGCYVPEGVREFVSIDIGALGPDNAGTERSVSIMAADMRCVYDRELTGELIRLADNIEIPYTVEVFPFYGTDARAAFLSNNNLKHAAFGMNVFSSHGMERTFFDSIYHTAELCLAYVLRD